VNEYFWETKALKKYKETRNGLMGRNYSSKLSPWLACGALSPRFVYHEVKKFESKHIESESTRHFISELFWREFCHYYCYMHGNSVFYEYGALDKG
jgi:deoxyribodipyrimidine photo-lyase